MSLSKANSCDLNNYIVYADLAKLATWINFMLTLYWYSIKIRVFRVFFLFYFLFHQITVRFRQIFSGRKRSNRNIWRRRKRRRNCWRHTCACLSRQGRRSLFLAESIFRSFWSGNRPRCRPNKAPSRFGCLKQTNLLLASFLFSALRPAQNVRCDVSFRKRSSDLRQSSCDTIGIRSWRGSDTKSFSFSSRPHPKKKKKERFFVRFCFSLLPTTVPSFRTISSSRLSSVHKQMGRTAKENSTGWYMFKTATSASPGVLKSGWTWIDFTSLITERTAHVLMLCLPNTSTRFSFVTIDAL